MTQETERRAIAFIRTIANRCASCTHRREELCRTCPSRWANEIMRDYEAEQKPVSMDYSLAARKIRILDILQKAGRPLLSSEIDISNTCSKGLKQYTLLRMVKARQIRRVQNDDPGDDRHIFRYFIPKTTKPNRSKNGNPKNTHTRHGAK
jgi:hypothetical protein